MASHYENNSHIRDTRPHNDSEGFPYRALAMVLISIALVCVVVAVWLIIGTDGDKTDNPSADNTSTVQNATSGSPSTSVPQTTRGTTPSTSSTSPTESARVDKTLSVVVLNNSSVQGLARKKSDILKRAGWSNQTVPSNCSENVCGQLPRSTVFYRSRNDRASAEAIAVTIGAHTKPAPAYLRGRSERIVVVLTGDS